PDPWPPFSSRCLLVGANDGAIKHQVFIVTVCSQRIEHPFPHTGMTPPAETPMHGLPLAITLGQVAPVRPGAKNPQKVRPAHRLKTFREPIMCHGNGLRAQSRRTVSTILGHNDLGPSFKCQ